MGKWLLSTDYFTPHSDYRKRAMRGVGYTFGFLFEDSRYFVVLPFVLPTYKSFRVIGGNVSIKSLRGRTPFVALWSVVEGGFAYECGLSVRLSDLGRVLSKQAFEEDRDVVIAVVYRCNAVGELGLYFLDLLPFVKGMRRIRSGDEQSVAGWYK